MSSSFFTSPQLENLYIEKKLSTYDIAKDLGCDPKTVYYWLKKFNILTRQKKTIYINKNDLIKLYESGLSLKEIGNRIGCTASAVLRKCRKYNINTRFPWTTNIIHPRVNFSNDAEERAYLIGFRIGDLNVKQISSYASIIVKSNTTHFVQVILLKKLFSKYGPTWISNAKTSPNVFHFTTSLNNSFSFLIPKYSLIPNHVLRSKKTFFAFLAGYTDAEGSIRIYQNRARFRIGSYDKDILEQIHKMLLSLNIKNSLNLERYAGVYGKRIFNGDFYRITLNERTAISSCITLLLPYLQHERRRQDAIFALENVQTRLQYKM